MDAMTPSLNGGMDAIVRSSNGGMAPKRVGPSERKGKSAERSEERERERDKQEEDERVKPKQQQEQQQVPRSKDARPLKITATRKRCKRSGFEQQQLS